MPAEPGHRTFRAVLQVRPGEGRRAFFMLLYSIAAVGGVVITGQTATKALFLSTLPQASVPFMFILPPAALLAASAALTRVTGRLRSDRLIVCSYALVLLGVAVFWLLLQGECRCQFWFLSALFVFVDVASSLVVLQFWTFAGEIFNSLEAKRLFGLISGGSTIANVLFGAFITTIAARVGPDRLLFVVMASLTVCIGCVAHLGRRYAALLADAAGGEPGGAAAGRGSLERDLRGVLRPPLVRTMSGILIVVAVVSSIADYQLDLGLKAHYGGDGQGIVGFLGRFRLMAGMAAGGLQFLLAGRLLARFGVVAVLLLLPTAVMLGAGSILLTGGMLWAAAMPRACDVVLKYSVHDPAFGLLFLPIPATLRAKARAVLDGVVKPPVVMAIGLIFLWSGQRGSATVVQWAYVTLALVAVWVALVLRAGQQYVASLAQSIRFRRLAPEREKIDLADESAIRVIRQTLQAGQPARVLHALTLLPHIPRPDWTPHVAMLLGHQDAEVRLLALRYLGDHGAAIYADEVVACLRDADEGVRAAAVEALCALGRLQALPRVLPFLADSSPRVRAAAVLGLIKHAGLEGFLHAGEHLKAMLAADDWRARMEAARILEELDVPTFYHPLLALLDDPSTEVQLAAIRAAGRMRVEQLVPHLARKLEQPATRWSATEALASCLRDDLPRLEELLDATRGEPATRRQLVHLLRHHRQPRAVELLLAELRTGDDRTRGIAAESLLHLRDLGLPVPLPPLRAALRLELRRGYELHVGQVDLRGVQVLLEEALARRLQQTRARILMILDLLYPEVSHAHLGETLLDPSRRARATAVELLDNLVDRDVREELLPLLGAGSQEELEAAATRLQVLHQPPVEHLRRLAGSGDDWLCSCALHVAGSRQLAELAPLAVAALQAANPLVRESAAVALRRLAPAALQAGGVAAATVAAAVAAGQVCGDDSGGARMALSTLEKVFFLKGVPLFEDMPGEEIVGMVPILQEVVVPQGETFIRAGEEGDALYIVVAGEVGIVKPGGQVISAHAREVIGERSVLAQQPRSADCTALTEVVLLRIGKKDFWNLMEQQPKLAVEVLKVIVERYL